MQPLTFTRGPIPIVAENWVQKTEKILEILHCTDQQKVLYSTFQLAREVERWWTMRYATRYIELSCFTPYLISNEFEKTLRFEKGLKKDIRRLVGILQIREFFILVDKATVVKVDLHGDEVVREQKKRPVSSGSQTGSRQGPWKNTERQGPQRDSSHAQCTRCRKWHDGECQPFWGYCYNCSKPDHISQNCQAQRSDKPTQNQNRESNQMPRGNY
ncbi:uncharacterized protein LOC131160856 [Malania oleifera]|uniref:uncharacterized protein LOC131160856 n=1 Tax=Malania oleifera TaxID=397392 RepID=UPI0025AE4958|nr:uncharacterized protein LOC131160856 [Malania oleifera]